ncbi:MAG: fibronectin type III domain-containing protein [Acidimicrobiales bacterium]
MRGTDLHVRRSRAVAVIAALTVAATVGVTVGVGTAGADVTTTNYKDACFGTNLGITAGQVVNTSMTVDAPATVVQGSTFTIRIQPGPAVITKTAPAPFIGTVNNRYINKVKVDYLIPANATFVSASVVPGSGYGLTPGVSAAPQVDTNASNSAVPAGVIRLWGGASVDAGSGNGLWYGNATATNLAADYPYQLPAIDVTLQASGPIGSTIEPKVRYNGGTAAVDTTYYKTFNASSSGASSTTVTCAPRDDTVNSSGQRATTGSPNAGAGPLATITIVAPVPPSAPQGTPIALPGDGSVTLSWSPPANPGSSSVTGYRVTPWACPAAPDCLLYGTPLPPVTFSSTATTQTITGLSNGQLYKFQVAAISDAGTGPDSVMSTPVVAGAPARPAVWSQRISGDGQVTISGPAPADNGSPITGYVVIPYIGGVAQAPQTFSGSSTTLTVTGLTNGTAYTFRVAAVNARGTGPASPPGQAIVVGLPEAPTFAGARVPGDGEVTISWNPPVDNGSPITGYTVVPYIGGVAQAPVSFDASSTTRTITGLTNGVTYTFRVSATNARGQGPGSGPSGPVTPIAAP